MRGRITSWSRSYGFVTPDQSSHVDVFLHENDLPDAIRIGNARVGLRVEFDVITVAGKSKPKATNVFVLKEGAAGNLDPLRG